MRANHVIAVAIVLVCVGAKLTFLAAPIAEADFTVHCRCERGCFSDAAEHRESSGAGSPRHDIRLPVPCADDLTPFRAMGDWAVITADQATCSSCSGRRQINELQHARTPTPPKRRLTYYTASRSPPAHSLTRKPSNNRVATENAFPSKWRLCAGREEGRAICTHPRPI